MTGTAANGAGPAWEVSAPHPPGAPAPPSGDDVLAAADRARLGGDSGRWPEKLPVRQRLDVLLDPGSFVEDGLLAAATEPGMPGDGVVTGVGTVEGRPVTRAATGGGSVAARARGARTFASWAR